MRLFGILCSLILVGACSTTMPTSELKSFRQSVEVVEANLKNILIERAKEERTNLDHERASAHLRLVNVPIEQCSPLTLNTGVASVQNCTLENLGSEPDIGANATTILRKLGAINLYIGELTAIVDAKDDKTLGEAIGRLLVSMDKLTDEIEKEGAANALATLIANKESVSKGSNLLVEFRRRSILRNVILAADSKIQRFARDAAAYFSLPEVDGGEFQSFTLLKKADDQHTAAIQSKDKTSIIETAKKLRKAHAAYKDMSKTSPKAKLSVIARTHNELANAMKKGGELIQFRDDLIKINEILSGLEKK